MNGRRVLLRFRIYSQSLRVAPTTIYIPAGRFRRTEGQPWRQRGCRRRGIPGTVVHAAMLEQVGFQSQYWDHDATTNIACPIFVRWRGNIWTYSCHVLSDDMAQDNAWVQYVFDKVVDWAYACLAPEDRGGPIDPCDDIIFADNCAQLFESASSISGGWPTAGS